MMKPDDCYQGNGDNGPKHPHGAWVVEPLETVESEAIQTFVARHNRQPDIVVRLLNHRVTLVGPLLPSETLAPGERVMVK